MPQTATTVITSAHNPRLKALRKLRRARERARSGLFAAEGEDLVAAAQAAGRRAVEGFRVPGAGAGRAARAAPPGQDGFHEVQPAALAAASTLGSGTHVIGVYEQRWNAPAGPLCVYLHGVGDPGNVGTVMRSALAFGASCVALGPGCADPHSPKAVRASMGAIFSVSLARVADLSELPGEWIALVAHAGEPLWQVGEGIARRRATTRTRTRARGEATREDPPSTEAAPPALTLLVGAEREGLPAEVVEACQRVARIPIASESLNAAMAVTVALYEMTRASTRVSAS